MDDWPLPILLQALAWLDVLAAEERVAALRKAGAQARAQTPGAW